MSQTQPPSDHLARLREKVETLAVQVMTAEDASVPAQTLEEIRASALAGGLDPLAEAAAALLASLPKSGDSGVAMDVVSHGIQRLHGILDAGLAKPAPVELLETPAPAPGESVPPAPSAPGSLAQDPELLGDFVVESREHLEAIVNHLLAVEQNPGAIESLHAVFRGFHTIKGLAGFLEMTQIRDVAHEVETVLDLARNEKLAMTPDAIDVVLRGADYLKAAIDLVDVALAGKGWTAPPDNAALLAEIRALISGPAGTAPVVRLAAEVNQAAQASRSAADEASSPAPVPEATSGARGSAASAAGPAEARSIKVDTGKLDHLVDMVGEMVIAQSLLRHNPELTSIRNPRLHSIISQLSGMTSDVQKTAMSLRMMPVGQLFQRMGRFVRDLARKASKRVELTTSGEDTEIDRQIIEELADPLMHMIRNSVDHGLERPEERVAAGKNPVGRVTLAAQHQAGQILIEIADDGRGLNSEKILRKARERGLVAPGAHLSDAEIHNLIFEPGFSTADKVTDVSGRGVGMDVVKRNLAKLRGRIEVLTTPGQGTRFLLKLPLTLAIIDGLVVGVGRERYIVPIHSVLEMLRPAREAVSTVQGKGEMVLVRDSLLPIVRLHRVFRVEPRTRDPWDSLLIVVESEGTRFCFDGGRLPGQTGGGDQEPRPVAEIGAGHRRRRHPRRRPRGPDPGLRRHLPSGSRAWLTAVALLQ
jgi:two-component system chemotaxis sensor kinase CheA